MLEITLCLEIVEKIVQIKKTAVSKMRVPLSCKVKSGEKGTYGRHYLYQLT